MSPSPVAHDPSVRIGFWPQSGQTPLDADTSPAELGRKG